MQTWCMTGCAVINFGNRFTFVENTGNVSEKIIQFDETKNTVSFNNKTTTGRHQHSVGYSGGDVQIRAIPTLEVTLEVTRGTHDLMGGGPTTMVGWDAPLGAAGDGEGAAGGPAKHRCIVTHHTVAKRPPYTHGGNVTPMNTHGLGIGGIGVNC